MTHDAHADAGNADECSQVSGFWQPSWTGAGNGWWKVDLGVGNAQEVVKLRYKTGDASRAIREFRLQGSNDDSNWDELVDYDSLDNSLDRQWVTLTTTASYRYYKMVIDNVYFDGSGNFRSDEIFLYKEV